MNQYGYIHLEIVKNDRKYIFAMPLGAPLGEAYDAAFDALNSIVDMSKDAAQRMRSNVSDEHPSDSSQSTS